MYARPPRLLSARRDARSALAPGAFAWAAVALLGWAVPAPAGPELIAVLPSEAREFVSAGRPIRVDRYAAVAPGPGRPVLIVLHAVDGMEGENGLAYRALARDHAALGYDVCLVHYFDATGAAPEDADSYRRLVTRTFVAPLNVGERTRMKELFSAWTRTAADAVGWARSQSENAGSRVALVGFSLGGAVALASAGRCSSPPAAVVDFFGVVPWEMRLDLRRLPPTLIIHGDADRMVPVDEVYRLTGWLVSRRQRPELEVYAGADHMFYLNGTTPQPLLMLWARLRTASFLAEHLPVPPPVTPLP